MGDPLKIAQQRNSWVYYIAALPMHKRKGVRFVSHSERFLMDDGQLMLCNKYRVFLKQTCFGWPIAIHCYNAAM